MRHFGPTGSRFDHHPPPPRVHPDRGILYASERPETAFAEFFQATRVINRSLNKPWIVRFAIAEPLTLLDVTGVWMVKVGGGAAISSGEREQSRKWSRVFHEAYPPIDGLCYRSSLNPQWLAFALYERAQHAVPPAPQFHAPLTAFRALRLIRNAVAETHYAVVTQLPRTR